MCARAGGAPEKEKEGLKGEKQTTETALSAMPPKPPPPRPPPAPPPAVDTASPSPPPLRPASSSFRDLRDALRSSRHVTRFAHDGDAATLGVLVLAVSVGTVLGLCLPADIPGEREREHGKNQRHWGELFRLWRLHSSLPRRAQATMLVVEPY